MPMGHLLSSLSQSTLTLSRHYAGAFHAVAARRTKNQGRKGDSVEEENKEEKGEKEDKEDKEEDEETNQSASLSGWCD